LQSHQEISITNWFIRGSALGLIGGLSARQFNGCLPRREEKMCVYCCSNNRDMKQLINLLNTTLQSQPKQARPGRLGSASDRALSSVAAADNDNSDVAVVRSQASKPNLGVTFVKASPSVITVPSQLHVETADGCYGAEPRFQLGTFLIKRLFATSKLCQLSSISHYTKSLQ